MLNSCFPEFVYRYLRLSCAHWKFTNISWVYGDLWRIIVLLSVYPIPLFAHAVRDSTVRHSLLRSQPSLLRLFNGSNVRT